MAKRLWGLHRTVATSEARYAALTVIADDAQEARRIAAEFERNQDRYSRYLDWTNHEHSICRPIDLDAPSRIVMGVQYKHKEEL